MPRSKLGEDRVCKVCGRIFYADRARIKRKDALKYCSRKCYHKTRFKFRHKKICEYCGQEFLITTYDIFRNKGNTFCSQGCWHSSCKIGNYYQQRRNSEEYKKWRLDIYRRDYWTCQRCGIKGRFIVAHHILPVFEYPHLIFDIDNGLTLCKNCHKLSHLKVKKGKYYNNVLLINKRKTINQSVQNVGIGSEG